MSWTSLESCLPGQAGGWTRPRAKSRLFAMLANTTKSRLSAGRWADEALPLHDGFVVPLRRGTGWHGRDVDGGHRKLHRVRDWGECGYKVDSEDRYRQYVHG